MAKPDRWWHHTNVGGGVDHLSCSSPGVLKKTSLSLTEPRLSCHTLPKLLGCADGARKQNATAACRLLSRTALPYFAPSPLGLQGFCAPMVTCCPARATLTCRAYTAAPTAQWKPNGKGAFLTTLQDPYRYIGTLTDPCALVFSKSVASRTSTSVQPCR